VGVLREGDVVKASCDCVADGCSICNDVEATDEVALESRRVGGFGIEHEEALEDVERETEGLRRPWAPTAPCWARRRSDEGERIVSAARSIRQPHG
jgi:hypothetical protein